MKKMVIHYQVLLTTNEISNNAQSNVIPNNTSGNTQSNIIPKNTQSNVIIEEIS